MLTVNPINRIDQIDLDQSGFTSNSMDTVTLKTETTYPYSNCKMISEKLTSKMIP